jgi:hypothetical protein
VVSTLNQDGSMHSAVAWISAEDGTVAVNSARARKWPANLERDEYPFRQPGEERIKFVIEPDHVRHQKPG